MTNFLHLFLNHPVDNNSYETNIYPLLSTPFYNIHFAFSITVLSLILAEMQRFYVNLAFNCQLLPWRSQLG